MPDLCISIASRPGKLGTALHNAGYRALGLDFAYKAIGTGDLAGAIAGVRALGIRGCSVSMPFKEAVLQYLDELDDVARTVGAANTIVNENGRLIGFNTDVSGAKAALSELGALENRTFCVLGAGGAGRAVLTAIRQLSAGRIVVVARTPERAAPLRVETVSWADRNEVAADILINATPIGMSPDEADMPIDPAALRHFRAVMDLVVSPLESRLVREARSAGLPAIAGYRMAMHQAAAQFELYTKVAAPLDVFERTLRQALSPVPA